MKPPPAEKLWGWMALISNTTTVSTGMKIFHHTTTLLVSDSHLTPITLMIENASIRTAAHVVPPKGGTGVPAGGGRKAGGIVGEDRDRGPAPDGRGRHRPQKPNPPAGETRQAAECDVRKASTAAGDGDHTAELGMG